MTMVKTTHAQREAIKRLVERNNQNDLYNTPVTYRELRKRVAPGPDCIMLPLWGMWLGIEQDGYTHS